MFKAISWGQFTGFVLLGLALYYAYVGLTYYRAELLGLARGKGKAANDAPAPARPLASLIGRGPLIARPAIIPPAAPPEVAGPDAAPAKKPGGVGEGPESTEEDAEMAADGVGEELAEENQELGDLSVFDLPIVEVSNNFNDGNTIDNVSFDAKAINFTDRNGADSFQGTESGVETATEDYDPSFTIGVAQLGNYFERAAEGQLTQDELVEQEPALENTDLLVAFFQSSSKSAQQATSHLYAGVTEPTLD
ncbi:hypothetical protein [Hymenobacter sp. PAMC 26628]|uniref:hypothetical protein n=1 Tax=Hymenobacter sp. PAMC 26628 TaxID=1484118 RepID=UPI0007702655|nr:hypothetical protein [Hymenobacter sp. PAMC 26628]AMJ63996.1 hypothetical protein AXW84_00075 [Hymenobacter sp. PAMC 26628]